MLGRLCRWIRILGFSAEYVSSDQDDSSILERAVNSGRIIVTRDVQLSSRAKGSLLIRSLEIDDQLAEFVKAYRPFTEDMFSRCTLCDSRLEIISSSDPVLSLPPAIKEGFQEVYWCDHCGKAYWHGTHYDQMRMKISRLLGDAHEDS